MRQNGFTLLEILVALAVMGIAFVAIFQVFSAGLSGLAASDDYVNAVIRAEAKMREVLDDPALTERTWSEVTDDGFRIDAAVTPTAEDRTETLTMRLLQVRLTVHWTRGLKERSITLTTMRLADKKI